MDKDHCVRCDHRPVLSRRGAMQAVIGSALAHFFLSMKGSQVMADTRKGRGKQGDFGFLSGEWRIKNRRKKAGTDQWDEFEGEATVWGFLDGLGSLEELRIPARDFAGMGLRLLNIENGFWNDFWVNAKSPVLTTPGLEGEFKDGVGTFTAKEQEGQQVLLVRGIWDEITPDSCRWYQSVSKDEGQTWEDNWIMRWQRST